MQELWDDSVTPNKTMHQLIHSWFAKKYPQKKKKSQDVIGNASEALDIMKVVVDLQGVTRGVLVGRCGCRSCGETTSCYSK
ncbi:putative U box domain-containing protein [Helianthus debilis subsp. tardiflorus]